MDGWISQSRLGAGEGFLPKFRRKHVRPTEGRTASLTTRREFRCTTATEMTRRRAGATRARFQAPEQLDPQLDVVGDEVCLVTLVTVGDVLHCVNVADASRARPGSRCRFAREVVVPACDARRVRDDLAVRAHAHVRLSLRVAPCAADLTSVVPIIVLWLAPVLLAHELLHR